MTMHVGCKTEIGGTNGPGTADPDIQYFPRGQEFKISPATDSGANTDMVVGARDMLATHSLWFVTYSCTFATCSIAAGRTTLDPRFTTKHAGSRQGSTIQ